MNIYNKKQEALESSTDDRMFTHAHAEECQSPCHRRLYHSLVVRFFRSVLSVSRNALMLFGSFVRCFHLAMCFYAGDTPFYSHLKSD